MDRLLRDETKPFLDLTECQIVCAFVRVVRDIVHGDIWNDVKYELCELLDLMVHGVIADIEDFARYDFRFGFESMYENVDNVINVNERTPLLPAAHYIDH